MLVKQKYKYTNTMKHNSTTHFITEKFLNKMMIFPPFIDFHLSQ